MRRRTHIIVCWLLTLSLIGLPVFSVSANTLEQASDTPCQQEMASMLSHNTSQNADMAASASADVSKSKYCCEYCGDNCKCMANIPCHSSNNYQASAILQTSLFAQTTLTVLTVSEITILYHGRDTEPEITPPII